MTLWTIQDMAAWERLQCEGVLSADGRRVPSYFRHAYRWMSDQMRLRLSSHHARVPLWGWYHWQGIKQCRPDLRASGHLAKGVMGVRIESFLRIVSFFPISTPGIVSLIITICLSMSRKMIGSLVNWKERALSKGGPIRSHLIFAWSQAGSAYSTWRLVMWSGGAHYPSAVFRRHSGN
jgi:hypothetical protein